MQITAGNFTVKSVKRESFIFIKNKDHMLVLEFYKDHFKYQHTIRLAQLFLRFSISQKRASQKMEFAYFAFWFIT